MIGKPFALLISLTLVPPFLTDSKYTKFMYRYSFLKSEMSHRVPSNKFVYNVTILGGCRIANRKAVGIVTTAEFEKGFGPAVKEAFRKFMITLKFVKVMPAKGHRQCYRGLKTAAALSHLLISLTLLQLIECVLNLLFYL